MYLYVAYIYILLSFLNLALKSEYWKYVIALALLFTMLFDSSLSVYEEWSKH